MKLVATIPTAAEERAARNDDRAELAGRIRRARETRINQRIAWAAAPNHEADYADTITGILCEDQYGDIVVGDNEGRYRMFNRHIAHHRHAWRATASGAGVGYIELED